jgi:hypothetical protein
MHQKFWKCFFWQVYIFLLLDELPQQIIPNLITQKPNKYKADSFSEHPARD